MVVVALTGKQPVCLESKKKFVFGVVFSDGYIYQRPASSPRAGGLLSCWRTFFLRQGRGCPFGERGEGVGGVLALTADKLQTYG